MLVGMVYTLLLVRFEDDDDAGKRLDTGADNGMAQTPR